jgi:hypothetical protein
MVDRFDVPVPTTVDSRILWRSRAHFTDTANVEDSFLVPGADRTNGAKQSDVTDQNRL